MSNTLSRLMGKKDAEIQAIVSNIDAATAPRGLRRKFEKIRNKKQGGFTLLELLVVVAILAAIAGTATIMLHDTDKKAFAAAHVGMMDELSKGILTYAQLNNQKYPNEWDSLLSSPTGVLTGAAALVTLSEDLTDNLTLSTFAADDVANLDASGITKLRVIDETAVPPDTTGTPCAPANIVNTIRDKSNNVTSQNIFRPATANGCGTATSPDIAAGDPVYVWSGDPQRIGLPAASTDKVIALGVGPDATLFQSTNYGALTSVPIYRHVEPDQYNRFIVLFNVTSNPTSPTNGKAVLQAIVDGAGDTKDEELGEFDNVRPT